MKKNYRKPAPMTPERKNRQRLMSEYVSIRQEVGERYYGPDFKWTNLSRAERAMLDDLTMQTVQWRTSHV